MHMDNLSNYVLALVIEWVFWLKLNTQLVDWVRFSVSGNQLDMRMLYDSYLDTFIVMTGASHPLLNDPVRMTY